MKINIPLQGTKISLPWEMTLVKSSTQIRAGWDRGYVSFVEGIP